MSRNRKIHSNLEQVRLKDVPADTVFTLSPTSRGWVVLGQCEESHMMECVSSTPIKLKAGRTGFKTMYYERDREVYIKCREDV